MLLHGLLAGPLSCALSCFLVRIKNVSSCNNGLFLTVYMIVLYVSFVCNTLVLNG